MTDSLEDLEMFGTRAPKNQADLVLPALLAAALLVISLAGVYFLVHSKPELSDWTGTTGQTGAPVSHGAGR